MLKAMNTRLPFKILNTAQQATTMYPYAISLRESVHVYEYTNKLVNDRENISVLLSSYLKTIHGLFEDVNLTSFIFNLENNYF